VRVVKIVDVVVLRADYLICVRIDTDAGISGFGEAHPASGTAGQSGAVVAAILEAREFIVGRDPARIEEIWQHLFRRQVFRGGADPMAAMSAIDVALWDIAARAVERPIHALLGGAVRERVRVYAHLLGDDPAALAASAREAVAAGYTAVRLYPFGPFDQPLPVSLPGVARRAAASVEAVRLAVGDDVDVMIDTVCRLTPTEALEVARAIEPYRLLFFEDPIEPDDPDAVTRLAARSPVPIATGERLLTIFQFRQLIAGGSVAFIRPDPSLVGGITGFRKIAALAEAAYVGVVPHMPLGPILLMTCLHLSAVTSGVPILEYPGWPAASIREQVSGSPRQVEGFLPVPTGTGLGAEFVGNGTAAGDFDRRPLHNADGSLRDY
jgi:galactonate dehydratase